MILCCGEALIDMIPTPAGEGPNSFASHTGGAVFNTAIALGRLGVQTGMLSGLSRDVFGQQLLSALKASHVDTAQIIHSDRHSTLAFVQLVDGQATYDFFDENSAGRMLTHVDMPTLPDTISTLFFGGISLACEPCADAYAALLTRESAPRVVMIDPNIRPGFIKDVTRYRDRLNKMIAQADIIKVSDDDLNWFLPAPLTLNEKVAVLLDQGPSLVILTQGGDGATGYLKDGREVYVPATKVQVIDTVGAGDTFNAGVLARLSADGVLTKKALATLPLHSLENALQYGACVAAVAVSRAGANPPWQAEL